MKDKAAMSLRDHEMSITVPRGQRRYCTVCGEYAEQDMTFVINTNNKFMGRHRDCVPQKRATPADTPMGLKNRLAALKQRKEEVS